MIESVNMKGSTPPTAYDNSFTTSTYETTALTVPVGAKSAYQSADVWKNFVTIREEGVGLKDGDKFKKDGIFCTIISVEDKTVEVTFKGETYNEVSDEYSGEVIVPQTVNYEDIDFRVVGIGLSAFDQCSAVTSVVLPNSITYIGAGAFNGTSISSITLPASVTTVDGYAFYNCRSLVSIIFEGSTPPTAKDASFNTYETTVLVVPVGAKSAYQSADVWKNFATILEEGESVIKDGDKFEKDGMFYTILSVEDKTVEVTFKGGKYDEVNDEYSGEVVVPQTVNYKDIDFMVVGIGASAFARCSAVTSVVLPNSITNIGSGAFNGVSISAITLPSGVTTVGGYAFYNCSSLASIILEGSTPPTAYNTSFDNYETTVLTVPAGAKSAYQSADVWKNFATILEEGESEIKDGDKFETDGIYYKIVSAKDKTAEVTFKGETYDEVDNEYQGDVVIPQTVSYEDVDFTVVGVGEKALYGCDNIRRLSVPLTVSYFDKGAVNSETLRELYWNSTMAFSKSVFVNPDAATNMILYITAETACDYDGNVVRDGVAENIVLTDALPLQITTGFKAKRISYTRHFDKVTVPHKPGGWESIVLPFDVQSFLSEEAGEIAPFNSGNAGARPFMLAQMTGNGFAVATEMKANVPYILVMPNSEVYGDDENISGNVMFCAESAGGVAVKPTVEAVKAEGSEFDLVPSYEGEVRDFSVYALNEMSYNDMLPGSAFVSGLREVKPFEAYASVESKPANAKTHFVIGGNGSATDIQRLYDRLFEGLEVESRDGVLYIHSSEAQNVGLYSSDGRLVRIMRLNEGVNTVTGLAKGVYMVGKKKVAVK